MKTTKKKKNSEPSLYLTQKEEVKKNFLISARYYGAVEHTSSFQRDSEQFSIKNGCMPLFAKDIDNRSKKSYLSCSYFGFKNLITEIRKKNLNACNFYEIVNPALPVDFYIDCDVYLSSNEDFDHEKMFEKLVLRTKELMCKLKYAKDVKDIATVVMDATTKVKFSRHVIFRLPDSTLFKDVFHCQSFAYKLEEYVLSLEPAKDFMFFNEKKTEKCFAADLGVYTSCRLFRTIYSTKLGKANPFLPHGETVEPKTVADFMKFFVQYRASFECKTVVCMHAPNIEPTRELSVKKFKKEAIRPDSVFDDTKKKEIAKKYYSSRFDYDKFWDLFGNKDREFAFEFAILKTGEKKEMTFSRYKFFQSKAEFSTHIKNKGPVTIHVGPLMKDKKEVYGKTLSFDVDLDDYAVASKNIRKCCGSTKKACSRCWLLMRFAFHVLEVVVANTLKMENIKFYFSGMKGGHCWVFDRRTETYGAEERKTLINLVNKSTVAKNCWVVDTVMKTGYYSVIYEKLIECAVIDPLPATATEREKALLIWPVFDSAVTTDMRHCMKAPQSLHASSLKPVREIEDYKTFNPFE